MLKRLSNRSIWLLVIFVTAAALVTLTISYRSSIKGAVAAAGLRIAAPFVRDLTAPSFSARDKEIEILRSENAHLKENIRRIDEFNTAAQAQALASVEALQADNKTLKENVRRIDEFNTAAQAQALASVEALQAENKTLKENIRRLDEVSIAAQAQTMNTIDILRSQHTRLTQDILRLDEVGKAQAHALAAIDPIRSELAGLKRNTEQLDQYRVAQGQKLDSLPSTLDRFDQNIRRIEQSHMSFELLKREYLTPLRRRLSALDGLDPSSRGATVLDLDRQEEGLPNLSPVVAMLDDTSLYSKGDRIELYGVNLKQTRSGPILIKESILSVQQSRAALLWWPRYSNLGQATHVRISLSASNRAEQGTISLLMKLRDGQTFRFGAKLGDPRSPAPAGSDIESFPADIATMLNESATRQLMIRKGNDFAVELPPQLRAVIAKLGADAIDVLALEFENLADNDVNLSEVSFLRPKFSARKSISIFGNVLGQPQPPGSVVKLLGADGSVRTSPVSPSSSFVFRDVPKGEAASIRFNADGQDYFADQGRWIVPKDDMTVAVHVEPLYVNNDNHEPDPLKREFHFFENWDNPGASLYLPHSRQRWNGAIPVQQFDSITFSNNWGHIDRDRFAANPEGCYRIVHLGSSHTVAIQVPVAQKYNFLLEEELGLKLKRCVEVLSAGRDGGDPGANYPTIRSYAVRFKPDVVMLEIQASLLMQLEPTLLRKKTGWDPQNSAVGRFDYGPDGQMKFQAPNLSNYLLYSKQPDLRQYAPGIDFYDLLKVEWNKLPEVARKTYRYLVDIMSFYRKAFPGIRFVLQTGVDQVQCAASLSCADRVVTASDGTRFKAGVDSLLANLKRVCSDSNFECINIPKNRVRGDPRLPLIFDADGHFNIRGHQWLAKELAVQISGNVQR
jgi:hypothetical protein